MAKDEPMGCRLRERMCYLPTKQDPDPQKKNPNLWNNHNAEYETLLSDCSRPNHRLTTNKQEGRDPNHSRPWMFQSGHLHSLYNNNHRTRYSTAVLAKRLPLVQPSLKGHLRQRP